MSIKVVKPFRLSLLYRPYRWHAKDHLCVTVFALADLSGKQAKLLSDIELWRECLPDMDCEGLIDPVLPKQVPEFLVAGQAYTAHQDQKNQVMVKAQVAGLEKELVVFGDRHWLDNQTASEPQDFEQMALCWSNTYGGSDFALNPLGKGRTRVAPEDELIPLANIEGLSQRVHAKKDQGVAVGFSPINLLWPQRYQHIGSYSEQWRQHEFPGFFADMNPLFFNAAPVDQQWEKHETVPLGEAFSFWNMHPDKPCWQGQIPNWRVRCFAKQQKKEQLEEVEIAMRATTAWFLPHQERVLLIFHGNLPIATEDGSDVRVLMPALEPVEQSPLATSYYFDVLEKRIDPQLGGIYVDADEQLIPAILHAPLGIEGLDVFKTASWLKAQQRQQQIHAELSEHLIAQGKNPDEYRLDIMGPPRQYSELDLSDQSWSQRTIEQEREKMLAEMDASFDKELLEQKIPEVQKKQLLRAKPSTVVADMEKAGSQSNEKGPPQSLLLKIQAAQDMEQAMKQEGRLDVDALAQLVPGYEMDDEMQQQIAAFSIPEHARQSQQAPAMAWMQEPEVIQQMQRLDELQRQMYLLAVQTQRPVDTLSTEQSQALREKLLEQHTAGQCLKRIDLTGALLTDLTLTEANLSQSWLEGVDLSRSVFTGCCFDEAVLARANLENARFIDCRFIKTNFSLATMKNTVFESCHFEQVEMEKLNLSESYFHRSTFEEMFFNQLHFDRCVIEKTTFHLCMMDEVEFSHCQINQSTIKKVTFQQSTLRETNFLNTELDSCGFFITQLTLVLFIESDLKNSAIHYESTVEKVQFSQSSLYQCFFREMAMQAIDFSDSRLEMCDFSLCDLTDAQFVRCDAPNANFSRTQLTRTNFTQAHLVDAQFKGADLRWANFTQANLFRAEVALAHMDDSTILHGAYLKEANVYPQRVAEVEHD